MSGAVSRFLELELASRLLVLVTTATLLLTGVAIMFAVVALVLRWKNQRKARRWDGLEARWEADLLDLLGGDILPDALTARVSAGDALYFVDYLSRFARRLRGSERAIIAEMAAPYLPRVARQLQAPQAVVRARAVRTLSLLGLHDHAHDIISALDDRSPLVAMAAARALTRREQPNFAHAVLVRLRQFGDWSPAFLATMLAAVGPDAAPLLRATLANEQELAAVRVVAADALRALHDVSSTELAAALASTSTDRNLVAAALRLLKACGSPLQAPGVRTLAAHPDEVVRMHACAALGTLGGPEDVPRLAAALNDASVWVAWRAANALLALGARAALERVAGSTGPRAELAREALDEAA